MKPATKRPRVVLDTNVYLSGLLFGGKPAKLVSKGILGEFQIVVSQPILVELGEKLIEKFSWPEDRLRR